MSYTTILGETCSDYGGPYVYYIVEAQTANRTSSTIDVDIRVSARLGYSDSTLGTGNELFGNITIQGQSHEVTIHGYYDSWSGNTTWHSVTTSFTVTGLSNSTTTLSATFGVTSKWLNDYQDQGSLSTRTCSNISISSYTPPEPPEPEPPEPPEPPTPSVNTISVQPIPDFIAGYDGDSFMLTCNPSGGTGYSYKWCKYAGYYGDPVIIDTSQTLTGTLYNDNWDNNYIYCIVTDSTGGTATTNKCEFRVGTSASQTQVSTKQIEPVRIYNGSRFLYGIPLIYNSGWKYNSWNITYTGNNRANIAIAGNAIVG